MKKKFLIGIVLLVIIIIIGYSASYLEQGYKSYHQILAEEFVQEYLKQEFRPSKVNLTLSESEITGKPYYTFGWRKDDDFQVKVEYNKDGTTLSHLTLYIFGIVRDISADYFFISPDIELDCFEINQRKSCKASWFDGENRIDLLIVYTVDNYVHDLYLCKMYEESEVYDKTCGVV